MNKVKTVIAVLVSLVAYESQAACQNIQEYDGYGNLGTRLVCTPDAQPQYEKRSNTSMENFYEGADRLNNGLQQWNNSRR